MPDSSDNDRGAAKANSPVKTTSISGSSNITPAVRRFHKKSRTGCKKCKARKIKCDERHPACLNCISHGVKCPYLETSNVDDPSTSTPRHTPPVSGGTSSTSNTKTPESEPDYSPMEVDFASTVTELCNTDDSIPTELSNVLPMAELELLHHFTFNTYSTLTHETTTQEFWRTTAIQVGLKCDYMMQAILAVSSLHLAYQTPHKRDLYIARGVKLHRQASRSAMQFMDRADIDIDKAVSLFYFSSLTMYFALACPKDHTLTSSPPSPTANTVFPEWTFLLNGTKSLTNILGPQADTHPLLKPFLGYGLRRWNSAREVLLAACSPNRLHVTSPSTNNTREGHHRPTNLEQSALKVLRRRITDSITLAGVQTSSDPAQRAIFTDETLNSTSSSPATSNLLQIYTHALDELDISFAYTASFPLDPQDATLWLWQVSDSLVPFLKNQPPTQEAVVIFAHFAILLKRYEDEGKVWWVQGWAKHIVRQVHDVLNEIHKPWIVWPMREVGLDFDFAAGGIRNTMFISLV